MIDNKDVNKLLDDAKAFNTATDDEVALMRAIGERAVCAEKMSWTTARIMSRRPSDRHVLTVLVEELDDYLRDTATMVESVRAMILEGPSE